MTTNYDQLKIKAEMCHDLAETLDAKKEALVVAQQEATQAKSVYDATKSDLDRRTAQQAAATADLESNTALIDSIVSAGKADAASMLTLLTNRGVSDGSGTTGLYVKIAEQQSIIDVILAPECLVVGAAAPTANDGKDGNYFLDTTGPTVYGPKASGVWPAPFTTVGTATKPTAGDGVDGNYHVNTSDNTVTGPKDSGAWPSTPFAAEESVASKTCERQVFIDQRDAANGKIILYRIELEQQQAALVAAEATLASLKEAYPNAVNPSPEYTSIQNQEHEVENIKKLINSETGTAGDAPGALDNPLVDPASYDKRGLKAAIEDEAAIVTSTSSSIITMDGELTTKITELRTAEAAKDGHVTSLQGVLASLGLVINRLQDSIGFTKADIHPGYLLVADNVANSAKVAEVADHTEVDTNVNAGPPATPQPDSTLDLAHDAKTELTDVKTAYDNLVTSLTALIPDREAAKNSTQAAQTAASQQVDAATTNVNTCHDALQVLLDKQVTIEVDAAAALLEDFLQKGAVVITEASAPTVETAVQTLIDKTCESSKVRSLVSQVKTSYTDEAEYKALREQFCADPVNAFFNVISDPCFVFLSEAEVEAFRNAVRAAFAAKAKDLCNKYVGGGSTGSFWLMAVIAVLVVVVLVGAFLLVR